MGFRGLRVRVLGLRVFRVHGLGSQNQGLGGSVKWAGMPDPVMFIWFARIRRASWEV